MLSLRWPANYPAYILHKMVRLARNGAAVKMSRLGTTLPILHCSRARLLQDWRAVRMRMAAVTQHLRLPRAVGIPSQPHATVYATPCSMLQGRQGARTRLLWGGRACGKAGQIQSLPSPQPTYASRYAAQPWSFCQGAWHSCALARCVHSYYEKRRVLWASSKAQRAGAALARTGCKGAIGLPWAQSMARCASSRAAP